MVTKFNGAETPETERERMVQEVIKGREDRW